MSKFSEYLAYLINRNGEPISTLARNAGVERTSVHKALTGERMLSYKSAHKLSEYFRLSPHETQIFFEYHNMQLQGEDTFRVRKEIVHLLKTLSSLSVLKSSGKITPSSGACTDLKNQQIYSGEFAVCTVIRQAIDRELTENNPAVFLNLPAGENFVLQYIHTVYQQYKTPLQLFHIVPYRTADRESASFADISMLKNVLFLSLSARKQYSPCFFYYREDNFAAPFPYYLLTTSCLLCIAKDLDSVLCLTEASVLQHYRETFHTTESICHPLLQFQQDPFEILNAYSAGTSKNSYYTLMPQPCLGRYYSASLIAKKLHSDLPAYQKLLEKATQRFALLRSIQGDYYTFFTREGLSEFMKTGVICDIPRQLISPCTPEERRMLLQRLRDGIQNDSITGRLINDHLITLPSNLSFCISEQKKVSVFVLPEDGDEDYFSVHIDETLIGNAFLDFVLYLPRSEYVLSKEATLDFLDELCGK